MLTLASLRLRDTIGLILGAIDTPAAGAVLALARANGARPPSGATLVTDPTPIAPSWAALAHGTIAHCRDFDDTFANSVVHPGSTIVSTALALAEAQGTPSDDLLAAIAIGYEIAARLGRAGGRQFHARGFHATGIHGPTIAACVAARLLGLTPAQTTDAIGLASSMAGGLLAFLGDGTWSKWLHVGWSAHGGILAAELAAQGFRGPESGTDALFAAFLGAPAEVGTTDLGTVWRGGEALPKYYPCAHVIQPYIAATLAVRASVPGDSIASIVCEIAPWAVPIVCEPLDRKRCPGSEMDVIASLPFHVAAAWVDGLVDLGILDAPQRDRADLLAAAAQVTYRPDATLGRGFDGAIVVTFRDGRTQRHAVPPLAIDPAAMAEKFTALAARTLPASQVAPLAAALTSFPPDWCSVTADALRAAGPKH
jgi:2-methylcitrate dehydratase PrpD